MLRISSVEVGSIAEQLDIAAGDTLLAINGQPIRDLLDFQLYITSEEVVLDVQKADGEHWELEVEKDAPDTMGLDFEHPLPAQCGNSCIFCFVHQLPRGMRSSLYVKDEDYRFSYLYGAYVTLSNIREEELQRIIDQQLSPLYVSVHATDEELRARLLGRITPPLLPILKRLIGSGIEIHTQIVLCPGYNDGNALRQTVDDLLELRPGILSLAIVPVGLTGHRQLLPPLRPLNPAEAAEVLDLVEQVQATALAEHGSRFIFAADELYLKAERPFPPLHTYEDLPQVENGVGMIPLFRHEAAEALAEAVPLHLPPVSLLTGVSAAAEVRRFTDSLALKTATDLRLHVVENNFFGGHVTVTGLLTGHDLLSRLRGADLGSVLLLPDVLLRDGEDVLLDDLTLPSLEQELGVKIMKVASNPWGLLEALEIIAEEEHG
jgi:putative radical SAM enzyme (TIGR03279 family)